MCVRLCAVGNRRSESGRFVVKNIEMRSILCCVESCVFICMYMCDVIDSLIRYRLFRLTLCMTESDFLHDKNNSVSIELLSLNLYALFYRHICSGSFRPVVTGSLEHRTIGSLVDLAKLTQESYVYVIRVYVYSYDSTHTHVHGRSHSNISISNQTRRARQVNRHIERRHYSNQN